MKNDLGYANFLSRAQSVAPGVLPFAPVGEGLSLALMATIKAQQSEIIALKSHSNLGQSSGENTPMIFAVGAGNGLL